MRNAMKKSLTLIATILFSTLLWADDSQGTCTPATGTCGASGSNLTWELSCDGVMTISGTGAMADYDFYDSGEGVFDDPVPAPHRAQSAQRKARGETYAPWDAQRADIRCVRIAQGITHIGSYAFYLCTNLDSIFCDALTPPTCGAYAFTDVNTSIPVYVPSASVDTYKAADGWLSFTNILANPEELEQDENNLFVHAAVTAISWFGDANWNEETESSASYNALTGVATVRIAQDKDAQWKAQLFLETGLTELSEARLYTISATFTATADVSNVTLKMFDNYEIAYVTTINLQAGQPYTFVSEPSAGHSSNGKIVFDFGYASAGTVITIRDITITESVPTPPNCYLVGSCEALGAWSIPNAPLFVPEAGNLTGSVTVDLEAGEYEFKIVEDGNWLALDGNSGRYTVHRDWPLAHSITYNGDNMKLVVDQAGSYTFRWTYESNDLDVVYPPFVQHYYLVGGGLPIPPFENALLMDGDSVVLDLPANVYEFKVLPQNTGWDNELGFADLDTACSSDSLYDGGTNNVMFKLAHDGLVKIKVVEGKLCVTGDFGGDVPVTAYSVVGDSALVGAHWIAEDERTNMTQQQNGTWTYTIDSVVLQTGKEYYYKVIANHSWHVKQYPDNEYSYVLTVPQSGLYAVTFTFTTDDGCNYTLTPAHIMTWMVCGEAAITTYHFAGQPLVLPTPTAKQSVGKTFVGWISTADYNDTIAPTLVEAGTIVTGDAVYYAVVTNMGSDAVLWAEDFSGYSAGAVPSGKIAGSHQGTTILGDDTITYTISNGSSSSKSIIYNENLATGASPELLVAKSNGSFTISGIPANGATAMTLTFKTNRTSGLSAASTTSGITVGTITIKDEVATCTVINSGVAYFDLTITNTNTNSNARVDNFQLKGAASSNIVQRWFTDCGVNDSGCGNFDSPMSLVGGFAGSWSLDSAIAFAPIGGVMKASVPDIAGAFKVVIDNSWDHQWGANSSVYGLTPGTPYTMTQTNASGTHPENLAFANPLAHYRNAVFTLTENTNCSLMLTMVSGEEYFTEEDWYLVGTNNDWTISDTYKFTRSATSDSLILELPEWSNDLKIVCGTWLAEFGANYQSDRWNAATSMVMGYPAAGNLQQSDSRVLTNVRIAILPDYAHATVALTIRAKAGVSISATHGTTDIDTIAGYIGEQATVTVNPDDGYVFSYWSDFNTENPRTITINENVNSLTAVCVPIDTVVYRLCLASENERSVYFIKPDNWQGDNIHCYLWDDETGQMTDGWPGNKATAFTERLYKFIVPDEYGAIKPTWNIIWNNGSSSQQTEDHKYVNNGVYSIETDVTYGHGNLTTINYICTNVCQVIDTTVYDTICAGFRYYYDNEVKWKAGDYQFRHTYISSVGGDSVVAYNLHVDDCSDRMTNCSYDLQFRSADETYDSGTMYLNDPTNVFTPMTAGYASAVTDVYRVYPGKTVDDTGYGAKFGASSAGGKMKIRLAIPLVVDSMVLRAARYGSDQSNIVLNGSVIELASSNFSAIRVDSLGWTDELTIEVQDAYKRFYIQSISLYGRTLSHVGNTSATICLNDTYAFGDRNLQASGLYANTITTADYDSVTLLTLNVIEPIRVVSDYDTMTNAQQLEWHGRTILYPSAGDYSYYDTVQSTLTGCDSINELKLHVIKTTYPVLTATLDRDTVIESESTVLTIRSSYALPADETIRLSVNDGSSYLSNFPSSVILPAGDTLVTVTVATKDNTSMHDIITIKLKASGTRFSNTASDTLAIIDNDTPEISLTLSVDEVNEGECARCITATVRRLTVTDKSITIRLSDNSNGRINYPSSSLKMAAGVTELTATLGVIDNAMCEGTQTVDIYARVNNAYLPCAFDTARLTIHDNDVPTLTLRTSTTMMLEGKTDAATLTVSRNTPTDTALVVSLSVDNADGLSFPATLTIPAGESQAQTTVAVERNGISEDSHSVTFSAACEGFVSAECYAMVIDQTLPDAVISALTIAKDTAEVGEIVNVDVTVHNQGAAGLAKGITVNLYFAGSRVAQFALPSTLPIDSSVTFNTEVTLPENVGRYTLYATVNEDKQVKEIVHTNNRSDNRYITATPSFVVLSMNASKMVCMPGDSVILTGQLGGSKAANAVVEVYAVNNGYRTATKVTADNSGAFTAVFRPQYGQNGHFALGACYPSERSTTEIVGIDYYGMEVSSANITCMANTGFDYNGRISVRNIGSLTLSSIHAEATDVPDGCHITLTDISSLDGGRSGNISFTLHSDVSTPGNDWQTIHLNIAASEGLQAEKTIYYYSRDPRGKLICSENRITASVSIQRPMDYTFMLQNTGLGATGDIQLSLPDWIESVSSLTIPSIAPDEYAEVVLRFNTESFSDKLNLPVKGNIGLTPANCDGLSLPFTITPVSDITGTLHVDVCDENTYYAEGAPHVEGAQVLVKNSYTKAVITQGHTNAAGIYEAVLPEGYYTVSVTADNHDSYTNNILLQPEQTTSLTVNLSIKAISVSWTVEETTVEDTYEIVTTVNYETRVPQPVVVMNAPTRIAADELAEGESLIYNVAATNQGLIRAEDVTISLPSGGNSFTFEALAYSTPFNLEAKQSVVIPVKVTRVAEKESHAPGRAAPHSILECQDNMLTLYYWDCGTDRKWHQYATPLIYQNCDEKPTLPTPSPDEDDDWNIPLPEIHITIPFPWPPSTGGITPGGTGTYTPPSDPTPTVVDQGCEPCQNKFLLDLAKLGFDLLKLAADFYPGDKTLRFIKAVNSLAERGSEAVKCYNAARQTYDANSSLIGALIACANSNDNDNDVFDDLVEWLGEITGAEELVGDIGDVARDLYELVQPCNHTAENAAYAPRRSAGLDTFDYSDEPEYLARFKTRTLVVLEEIEALDNYKKLIICDSVKEYCSNAEIDDLMAGWHTALTTSPETANLNAIRPAALPDEHWNSLVERINNTYNFVRGIQPTNSNYVDPDSLSFYANRMAACEAKAQDWGYTSTRVMFNEELKILANKLDNKSGSVCASISLQFSQTMTLTRQAFRGTLSVFNGHETEAMSNIHLDLDVRSTESGEQATSHEFQISLEGLSDMSGEATLSSADGWTIAANTTGTATILFIPTVHAAPQHDVVWSFGGTLTYTDPFSGLTVTRDLYPVQLTVRPTPLLEMTYFMQRDVYADDPLTENVVEESQPAEFALLINNIGYGEAKNVNMQTKSPEIVDNKKGLLIDFRMLYAMLNGKQKSLPIGGTTTTAFGTIPAHTQAYAQWFFESTLLGHFNSYDVTATHVTSYDNPDLSLIDTVTIHEMIRSISVPAANPANAGWLVNDDGDINDMPEQLYISDGRVVALHTAQPLNFVKQDAQTYLLTVTPSQSGWNYNYCIDPTGGTQTLQSVTRLTDNADISLRNVWQTPCVMRDQADPVHEPRLHIADSLTTATTYRLVFSEPETVIVTDAQDASSLPLSARTDVTVTPTGHLTIDQPTTINSLTLQYAADGRAQLTGISNLTAGTVDMVLTIHAVRQWFAFAVPFDVHVKTGIRIEGASLAARYGYDYIIEAYDGMQRATTQDGWQRIDSLATLHAGKLYMLYAAGATTWRFTAADPAALSEATTLAIAANLSADGDHHSGWNGVANTWWSNATAALDEVTYATLYNNIFRVYSVVPMTDHTFAPAEPFFAQAVADDRITFAAPDAASAPWRRTAAGTSGVYTLALSDEAHSFTDKAYITIDADKADKYIIGRDLEKMQAAAPAVPQLWLEAYGMHLAAHELPLGESTRTIPVGLYAPAEGNYSLSLTGVPASLTVQLTKDEVPVWDIAQSIVLLPLSQGDNSGYALSVSRAPQVATDIQQSDTDTAAAVHKFIHDDQLYILRDGKIYSVTGVRVQ